MMEWNVVLLVLYYLIIIDINIGGWCYLHLIIEIDTFDAIIELFGCLATFWWVARNLHGDNKGFMNDSLIVWCI